jgi:hypothetical protein
LYTRGWVVSSEKGVARQLLPGRNLGELAHDEFQIALDRSEVDAFGREVPNLALWAKLDRLGATLALPNARP